MITFIENSIGKKHANPAQYAVFDAKSFFMVSEED
jgi:hypothetical protein